MRGVSSGLIQALKFLYRGSSASDELPVKCLLYANDQVIRASSACELQKMTNKMNDSVKIRSVKVNVSKTKVMVFERGKSTIECDILVEGEKVEQVKGLVSQPISTTWIVLRRPMKNFPPSIDKPKAKKPQNDQKKNCFAREEENAVESVLRVGARSTNFVQPKFRELVLSSLHNRPKGGAGVRRGSARATPRHVPCPDPSRGVPRRRGGNVPIRRRGEACA
ncbi:hypothetical protein EVAR_38454_1 [Eumeta japonica]|uniref:Reverse transcriptase domain-containing protein n=1 Tax=Eumeta variegata TaxID=151549 RepID=A0A4C1WLK2_EUMVA|nr:hypothetical protein EVAR_38454_1 [Eumeta japonica]